MIHFQEISHGAPLLVLGMAKDCLKEMRPHLPAQSSEPSAPLPDPSYWIELPETDICKPPTLVSRFMKLTIIGGRTHCRSVERG